MTEKELRPQTGWPMLTVLLIVMLVVGPMFMLLPSLASAGDAARGILVFMGIVLEVIALVVARGLTIVNPNQARALVLFGDYHGTIRREGFYWVNPFYSKRPVSLRARTFETGDINTAEVKDQAGRVVSPATRTRQPAKVNDLDGNPIEIAAVVVWQVTNTADALFEVDDYVEFVRVQSEAALRNLASQYHYDRTDGGGRSLRGTTYEVGEHLRQELHERLRKAGVEVLEARISYLAYAPEIAAVMLRRQQAEAVIEARQRIVEGATGMVDMALHKLEEKGLGGFNPEQRAQLVSNLLVVLCSEQGVQPVIRAG
ncbi:MAG: SPFH domain-containing protein [Phycisphaerae bacterium]|jgi:regulator of protease activity HflC (stomatin/prohibitin superfamily)|nr:SPFH domain-containing protein [Phycisphaerae bacterium]